MPRLPTSVQGQKETSRAVRAVSTLPPVSGNWMGRNISLPADADKVRFRFLRWDLFRKKLNTIKTEFLCWCPGARGDNLVKSCTYNAPPFRRFY
jgi:hypothetical protein